MTSGTEPELPVIRLRFQVGCRSFRNALPALPQSTRGRSRLLRVIEAGLGAVRK